MVTFVLGAFAGGIVAFLIFAVCSAAGVDDRTELESKRSRGEYDDSSK